MIYCPSCGTANRDGSRFCNECGTKLPTVTSALCPVCGTANPPNTLFCEKCGTRLVAALPDEPEEAPAPSTHIPKGLSLPTKSASMEEMPKPAEPAQPESEEMPDWMEVLRSAAASTSEPDTSIVTPAAAEAAGGAPGPAEEVPEWLSGLGIVDQSSTEFKPPTTGELLHEWTERLQSMPDTAQMPGNEEMPDWLKDLRIASPSSATAASSEQPAAPVQPGPEEEIPSWLKPGEVKPEVSASRSDRGFVPSENVPEAPQAEESPTQPQEELPEWLRDLRPAAATEDELPDWLDELGAERPEEVAPEETAISTGDAALDWVSQLSAGAAAGIAADKALEMSGSEEPISSAEAPDWLQGAGLAESGEQSSEAPLPDWLSTLRAAAPEIEAQPPSEEGIPAWLTDSGGLAVPGGELAAEAAAGSSGEIVSAESPAEPSAEGEMPDWLSALRAAAPEPEVEAAPALEPSAPLTPSEQVPAEEIPEWLRDLGIAAPTADNASVAQEPTPASTEEKEGIPDWLKGLGAAAAGAAAIGAVADQAGAEEQPSTVTPEQEVVTDWLAQLRRAAPEIEEQQVEEEEPTGLAEAPAAGAGVGEQPSGEMPDWLRDFEMAPPAEEQPPVAVEKPAEAEEEAGLPDWLKGLGIAAAGAAAAAAVSQPSAEERETEELPEWLRESGEVMPPPAATELPEWLREEKPSPESEAPEWMQEPGVVEQPAFESAIPATEEPEVAVMPDWLRDLAAGATVAAVREEPEESKPQPEAPAAEPSKELPGWLSEMAPAAAAGIGLAAVHAARTEQPAAPEAPQGELPEWVQDLRKEQGAIPVPPEQPTLAQAELPAWLEALRPAEGEAAAEVSEVELEKEGPLAGLAHVLTPAPLMGDVQGTPSQLHFDVSADDLARAGVLQELLTRAQTAPAPTELPYVKGWVIRRRSLRWIMLAVILFAVLLPAGFDLNAQLGINLLPRLDKLPMSAVPPSTQSAASQIASLPQNATVLVIFDYDATQAGELNRVANVLFQHLLTRGAHIKAATLNPQGQGIAQTVWDTLPAGQKSAGQFEQVGFAPGQAAGVQSLLARVGKADLVIDLAASPDSVRWWAEQLALNANSAPFVAGVSAAAETLTLPYIQSGQVRGLITGAAGALLYAKAAGLPTTFTNQIEIEAMTLANWALALIIVISLALALAARAGRRPVS